MVSIKNTFNSSSILESFIKYMEEKTNLSDRTIIDYKNAVGRFLKQYDDYDDIENYKEFLTKYTQKRNLNDTKRRRMLYYYGGIVNFIKFYVTNLEQKYKILEGIPKPRQGMPMKNRTHLSLKQLFELTRYFSTERHKMIALFLCITGMRIGDILTLKRSDVRLEDNDGKREIRLNIIGKGEKQHQIHISHDWIIDLILKFKKENNYGLGYMFLEVHKSKFIVKDIFSNKNTHLRVLEDDVIDGVKAGEVIELNDLGVTEEFIKKKLEKELVDGKAILLNDMKGEITNMLTYVRMFYNEFRLDLKQGLERMGIDSKNFSTHDFRRCFAKQEYRRHRDIFALKEQMNHSDVNMTLRYIGDLGLDIEKYGKEREDRMTAIKDKIFM